MSYWLFWLSRSFSKRRALSFDCSTKLVCSANFFCASWRSVFTCLIWSSIFSDIFCSSSTNIFKNSPTSLRCNITCFKMAGICDSSNAVCLRLSFGSSGITPCNKLEYNLLASGDCRVCSTNILNKSCWLGFERAGLSSKVSRALWLSGFFACSFNQSWFTNNVTKRAFSCASVCFSAFCATESNNTPISSNFVVELASVAKKFLSGSTGFILVINWSITSELFLPHDCLTCWINRGK